LTLTIEFGGIIKKVYRRVSISSTEPKIIILTEVSGTSYHKAMHGERRHFGIMMGRGETIVTDGKDTKILDLENSRIL
jgi:uncharacterized protein (DUF362 family)